MNNRTNFFGVNRWLMNSFSDFIIQEEELTSSDQVNKEE